MRVKASVSRSPRSTQQERDWPVTQKDITQLVARALRGDADAYRHIVDEYKERLYAFVWRIVRNHHEAEDLCQSAFVRAFESLGQYSPKYAFSTWLYTIAYRLCLNGLRKKRFFSGDVDFENVSGADADVSSDLVSSEAAAHLRKEIWYAVDELSSPQRTAVVLFYQESQSCQQIADIMGIPAVTVKSHLHRARQRLRDMLDPLQHGEQAVIRFPRTASA